VKYGVVEEPLRGVLPEIGAAERRFFFEQFDDDVAKGGHNRNHGRSLSVE
jgi:hypothetical protein